MADKKKVKSPVIPFGAGTPFPTVADIPAVGMVVNDSGTLKQYTQIMQASGDDWINAGRPNFINAMRPGLDEFSIEFYGNFSTTANTDIVGIGRAGFATRQWSMSVSGAGKMLFVIGGVNYTSDGTDATMFNNTYKHLTVKVKKTEFRFFSEGQLLGTQSFANGIVAPEDLMILTTNIITPGTQNFEGKFGYIKFWSGVGNWDDGEDFTGAYLLDCYDTRRPKCWNGGSTITSQKGNVAAITDGLPTGQLIYDITELDTFSTGYIYPTYGTGADYATVAAAPLNTVMYDIQDDVLKLKYQYFNNDGADYVDLGRLPVVDAINNRTAQNCIKVKFRYRSLGYNSLIAIGVNSSNRLLSVGSSPTGNVNVVAGNTSNNYGDDNTLVVGQVQELFCVVNLGTVDVYVDGKYVGSRGLGTSYYDETSPLTIGAVSDGSGSPSVDIFDVEILSGTDITNLTNIDTYDFTNASKWDGGLVITSNNGNIGNFTDGSPFTLRSYDVLAISDVPAQYYPGFPNYDWLTVADVPLNEEVYVIADQTVRQKLQYFNNEGIDWVGCGRPSFLSSVQPATDSFTVSIVVKTNWLGLNGRILSLDDVGNPQFIIIAGLSTTVNRYGIRWGSSQTIEWVYDDNDDWSIITVKSIPGQYNVFQNGTFRITGTTGSSESSSNLNIGGNGSANNHEGGIARVSFYAGVGDINSPTTAGLTLLDTYNFTNPDLWDGGLNGVSEMGNEFTVNKGTPNTELITDIIPVSML